MRTTPALEPRHSAIYLGRRFFQVAHAAAAEAHAAIGLSPLEFGVLVQLHGRPGVDQNTLAERLALDRTTIADVACFPYVESAPESGIPLDAYPNISAWLKRCMALPGWPAR